MPQKGAGRNPAPAASAWGEVEQVEDLVASGVVLGTSESLAQHPPIKKADVLSATGITIPQFGGILGDRQDALERFMAMSHQWQAKVDQTLQRMVQRLEEVCASSQVTVQSTASVGIMASTASMDHIKSAAGWQDGKSFANFPLTVNAISPYVVNEEWKDQHPPCEPDLAVLAVVPDGEQNGQALPENADKPVRKENPLNRKDSMKSRAPKSRHKLLIGTNEANFHSLWIRIVESLYFEVGSVTAIVLNAIYLGVQVEHLCRASERGQDLEQSHRTFFIVDSIFLLVFALELVIRFAARGRGMFDPAELSWTAFDMLVVLVGFIQFCIELTGSNLGDQWRYMSALRTARLVKTFRVIKIIRVLPRFSMLRLMLTSIVCSMDSLVWVLVILFGCFYLFGTVLSRGVHDYLAAQNLWNHASTADLQQRFGNLERTIMSLFMSMCGGVDWGDLLDVLEPMHVSYKLIFLFFISFAVFVLVNIVTGVFVESAMEASRSDRDSIIEERKNQLKDSAEEMEAIFHEMDADASGEINQYEFQKFVSNERVRAYFDAIKLDVSDRPEQLFKLMDFKDDDGAVQVQDFMEACRKLSGEARALDVCRLHVDVCDMKRTLGNLSDKLSVRQP